MYEVLISDRAKKQIQRLDKKDRGRITSVIDRIRIRPFAYVKSIVNSPYFRARAGDYRIILDIREKKMIVLTVDVLHRKKAHKRLP